MGLVLFGTSETSNRLNDLYEGANQYTNVTTARHLGRVDLDFFRYVQNIQATPQSESPEHGDMIDALIVGLDLLIHFTGTKKYKKRVFLITDGEKKTKIKK